jgi:DNA-binding response OmpR family regulator
MSQQSVDGPQPSAADSETRSAASPTVVLVDDDEDFRTMFADALRLDGMCVIEAAGGKDAIAAFDRFTLSDNENPALLVLDLMMPAVSGIEVLRSLRRAPRWTQLPVLVMTGVNDSMLPVRLNTPVVFKPDLDTLLTAVRKNLRRPKSALDKAADSATTRRPPHSDRGVRLSA